MKLKLFINKFLFYSHAHKISWWKGKCFLKITVNVQTTTNAKRNFFFFFSSVPLLNCKKQIEKLKNLLYQFVLTLKLYSTGVELYACVYLHTYRQNFQDSCIRCILLDISMQTSKKNANYIKSENDFRKFILILKRFIYFQPHYKVNKRYEKYKNSIQFIIILLRKF